jgi:hypothetical protein
MRLAKAAYSWERVSAEIAKCDVRCRNRHARVTYERIGDNWRSRVHARGLTDGVAGEREPRSVTDEDAG